ncbi:MAG TPA: MBL fold metallo-hydrolase, partial [Pyrinomonadaceae bacterium]|nr:MBL fold metallo-hydrolase [Pyrinomonadaceae bacterium]
MNRKLIRDSFQPQGLNPSISHTAMTQNRRQFLYNAAVFAVSARLSFGVQQRKESMRIILLGTKGGPRVGETGRKNPATLLLINDKPYLIDCGYGVSRQMLAAGVALNRLRYIFITHHHSDHNLEYGPVIYNAWATGFPIKVDAYGPPGLQKMTEDFFSYMKFDIDTRIVDEGRPDLRQFVTAHDFNKAGIVLENEDVKVSAVVVRHPPIKYSFAYRFDGRDRSVVISGDTAYAPELAEFARGADVLVHEVMYMPGVEALLKRVP